MANRRQFARRVDRLGRKYCVDTSTGRRATARAYERESGRRAQAREAARLAAEQRERALRAAATRKRNALERKQLERKQLERKPAERKAPERKAPERKALERKQLERKPAERKAPERKAVERKAPERKPAERKAPKAAPKAPKVKRHAAAIKGWETRRIHQYEREEREAIKAATPVALGTIEPLYKVSKRDAARALRAHAGTPDPDKYDRFRQYKRALYAKTAKLGVVPRDVVTRKVVPLLYAMAIANGFDAPTAAKFAKLS